MAELREESVKFYNDEVVDGQYIRPDTESDFDVFEEVDIHQANPKSHKQNLETDNHHCDVCMLKTHDKTSSSLCYTCCSYMCHSCAGKHNTRHELVKLKHKIDKRQKKSESFLTSMRRDDKMSEDFYIKETHVFGNVDMKHDFDTKTCWITGMTGLGKEKWVVFDNRNSCMKIFNTVDNTLLRCVRFGTAPRDGTEIKTSLPLHDEHKSTSDGKSKTLNLKTAKKVLDKDCLLAVTFPSIKQIWFMNPKTAPIQRSKNVDMDKQCYEIECSEDKLFTLCAEDVRPRCYSVDILSTEGIKLKTIHTTLLPHMYDLTVSRDRVYLTDWNNHKVYCVSADDCTILHEMKIDGSEPTGISQDQTGTVYISAWEHDMIYELDAQLQTYKPLNIRGGFMKDPSRLCFFNDKLFISHRWPSNLSNFITVIQLT